MQSFENPFLNPQPKKPFWNTRKGNAGYEELVVREGDSEVEEHIISILADDPELESKKSKLLAAGWKISGQGAHVVFEKEFPKRKGELDS